MRKTIITLLALLGSSAAWAQEATPLCTDRPTKATSPCTVPAGAVQIESDIAAYTIDRTLGVETQVFAPINPTIKLGLGERTDLQVSILPYARIDVTAPGGARSEVSGNGDLYVRLKHRFTDADANWQVAAVPFVKAPVAATGLGNDRWEGGLVMSFQRPVGDGWTLTLAPEIDALADADGSGHHVQLAGALNLGRSLSPTLTAYAELWTAQNFDPAGTVRQYSADVALAWAVRPNLQLDAGANFGLNRATPDAQLYLGISTRF